MANPISIEAAELLECFQWSDETNRDDLQNELADVLIHALRFARIVGIDPLEAIRRKLQVNRLREWPERT
jgi:dCTP diphosphatase